MRIPVHRVRGRARHTKSPQEKEIDVLEVFRKSGCKQQYPECPSTPSKDDPECQRCPHFPKQFK